MLRYLNWESNFFGIDVYLLEEFEINQKNYIKDFTKTLENKTLIRSNHPKNNPYEKYLENFGFKKVDDIFEYQLDLVNLKLNKIIKPNNNFLFEKLSNKHVDSFKSFSENYFDKSKYYFDKRFEKKLVDKMYLEWFTKSIKSEYDDEILGITHLRTIVAFASLKITSPQQCSIGLFGVNPRYFFNGFGRNMLENIILYAKNNSYKNLLVKTQGRNIAAKKLYSSGGFRLKARKTTMHLWVDPA